MDMSISRTRQLCFPAAALLALAASQALAADIPADGATCTLVDAITAANTDAAVGGCPAGSGADTITLSYSPTLAVALPSITSTITIYDGNTWYSINGGGGDFPVLTVSAAGNLTLKGVQITGANHTSGSGGGIFNDGGSVTVEGYDYAISSNFATYGGGIYNSGGTVTIKQGDSNDYLIYSNSADYGGGIFNDGGTVIVEGGAYAIHANQATGYGGGILNSNGGTTLVKDADIQYNSAGIEGGGIYSDSGAVTVERSFIYSNTASSGGGGLSVYGGTVTLNNTTVSSNSAGTGGGINAFGIDTAVTLNNCTVGDNTNSGVNGGGGIRADSSCSFTLRNSIVSNNHDYGGGATLCHEVISGGAAFFVDSYNVFGHNGETDAEAYCGGFAPGATDVNATTGDGSATGYTSDAIRSSSLALNSGLTQNYALPVNSPAIDIGPEGSCPGGFTDQRGFNRPINFKCDAGAYEYSTNFSAASGNGHDLPASTWQMTALSSSPFPATVSGVYSELGTYGTTWTAFRWNPVSQSYGTGALTGTTSLALGEGAWLYSVNRGVLTVGGTTTSVTSDCSTYGWPGQACRAINLTPSSGTDLWQIVGHVFPYSVAWADVRVAAYNGTTWTTYTPSEAEAANLMLKTWWRYTGSAYESYDDSTPGMVGVLRPQESFWVRIKSGSSALTSGNFKLLIPAR